MHFASSHIDKFLFGQGVGLKDFFIEQTPVSEVVCYRDSEGRSFDLMISDDNLAQEAKTRLKALGVRIVKVGLAE